MIMSNKKNIGRPSLLHINIGDIFGDLKCVDIFYSQKYRQDVYKMKCLKCNREKDMLGSTIRLEKGITHSACGQGLKTKDLTFYNRWQAMKTRTNNPNYPHYKDYGGRGINSDQFKYFVDFYDLMYDSFLECADRIGKENTSLERIDVNGNYCVENCMWIDKKDQPKNQRKTINFIATFPDGHTEICRNVMGFAKEHDLDSSSIYDCLSGKYRQHKNYKFNYYK